MNYKRKVRLEYYKVVCRKEEDMGDIPDRDFDLNLWISEIENLDLNSRTFDYYQEQARLETFKWEDDDRWFIKFNRLRDTNIPTKAKANEMSEPIPLEEDEYIGEEVAAIYDEKLFVLALQRNRFSLGPSGIEKYLNLVWKKKNGVEIYLRPILEKNTVDKVREAKEQRRITLRFADIEGFNTNLEENEERSVIKKLVDNLTSFKGIRAEMTISMGNNKGSLDREAVNQSLDRVLENRGAFAKAEVSIRESDDSKVEVVDLFSEKLHDFIFVDVEKRQSISEVIKDKILEKHIDSRAKIAEKLGVKRYGGEE